VETNASIESSEWNAGSVWHRGRELSVEQLDGFPSCGMNKWIFVDSDDVARMMQVAVKLKISMAAKYIGCSAEL
jgi:hypothetical protein